MQQNIFASNHAFFIIFILILRLIFATMILILIWWSGSMWIFTLAFLWWKSLLSGLLVHFLRIEKLLIQCHEILQVFEKLIHLFILTMFRLKSSIPTSIAHLRLYANVLCGTWTFERAVRGGRMLCACHTGNSIVLYAAVYYQIYEERINVLHSY
jgi:hypothetical protein